MSRGMTNPRFTRVAIATVSTLIGLATLTLAGAAAAAAETGAFVVRLGSDTVSVERYTRTPRQVVVDQVGRSPRVMRRHFVYDYDHGAMTHFSMVVTPAGATTPTQTVDATMGTDSLSVSTKSGEAPARISSLAMPRGTLVQPLSSLWTGYETQLMKLVAGKPDSLHGTQWYLGASNTQWFGLHRLGRSSLQGAKPFGRSRCTSNPSAALPFQTRTSWTSVPQSG